MFEEHMLLLYTYVVRTEHLRWFSRDFAGPCTACKHGQLCLRGTLLRNAVQIVMSFCV